MDYRLYFFEGRHIVHVVELDCKDDADAVRLVAEHVDGRAMELWQRGRLVKEFPADDPQSPTRCRHR